MRLSTWLAGGRPLGLGAVIVAASVLPGAAQFGERTPLFEHLAGAWSGAGAAILSGGEPERMRCRVDYTPTGPVQLHLSLRCATDSFALQVVSDLVRQGSAVSGTWTETGMGLSGSVSGVLGPDSLRANISAMGSTAALALSLRGSSQSISLSSDGQLAGRATVSLRRV
jgi:hypothetical protein